MTADGLAEIFQRVLDTDRVGEQSNFFDLGGDSLLATRVISAIAREYGVELTMEDLLLAPTPAGLVARIASVRR